MSQIDDDDLLLRHVPGGTAWQAPPTGRITSGNFELRKDRGETGVSTSWTHVTDLTQNAARVLQLRRSGPDSRIAVARVGDIRTLGFRVIEKQADDDPNHAEIESGTASLEEHKLRKRLANLFRYVAPPAPPLDSTNQAIGG